MQDFLDRLHASARRLPGLHRLAVISRILLALAFIPTGLVKLLGRRFTLLGTDNPVGAFFEAMYQTGFYWNFLGLGQVSAGILLVIPATGTLGAMMFLPIILNVTVVTWSIGFGNTAYVTSLMLLANVFLLCWDYDRLKLILFPPAARPAGPLKTPLPVVERVGYAVGATAGFVALLATRSFVPMSVVRWMLGIGLLAALMVLVGWIQAGRRARLARVSSRG
jgi:hypothetical protein